MPYFAIGVIMEFIIVRHAQSENNVNQSESLDSSLTKIGQNQIAQTANWFRDNFDLDGYVGLTSPYLRTLQTSEAIHLANPQVSFTVHDGSREYHIDKEEADLAEGRMKIVNRKELFPNFHWPQEHWQEEACLYWNETLDEFVARVGVFVKSLRSSDKYIIVGHAASCRVLHDTITKKDMTYLFKRYKPVGVNRPTSMNYESYKDDGIQNASLTWIVDGECRWFSKVVYEDCDEEIQQMVR